MGGERDDNWRIETGSVFGWGELRRTAQKVRESDIRRGSTSMTDHLGWRAGKNNREGCVQRKMDTGVGWEELVVRADGRT